MCLYNGKTKRGRPLKHTIYGLSSSTLRVHKNRQKKVLSKLLHASTEHFFCNALPEATPTVKMGRPLLPIEELTRRGAQTRRCRARRSVKMILLGLAAQHIEATYCIRPLACSSCEQAGGRFRVSQPLGAPA